MFGGNGGVSLADIGALLGNRNGNGGFGDNGGIWALIILFALFGRNGWGNGNGNDNGGGSNGGGVGNVTYIPYPMNMGSGSYSPWVNGALTRGELCQDMNFQEVQNGVRSIENNMGTGFSNVTAAITNGFSNMNSTICNQQYDTARMFNSLENVVQNASNQANITALTNQNALQAQLFGCCCDVKQLLAQAEYNRATDTCSITRAIQDAANAIVQNDNNNYRQLHDEQVALQMQGYKDRIAEQAQTINFLNLAQSQANQNNYLVQTLRPTPVPAYNVPNPYAAQPPFGAPQSCCCGTQVVGTMN